MNIALRGPMSRDAFFQWAEARDGRYEFDGFQPIAMVGGTNDHGTIATNILIALGQGLRGGPCRPMGAEGGGVATPGNKVRYPDAVVTCSKVDGRDRLVPNPVIVFEVLSSSTSWTDRVVKLKEYQAVPSITRYVMVDQEGIGVTVLGRERDGLWSTLVLVAGDVLPLPEIGIEIPLSAIYEGVSIGEAAVETQQALLVARRHATFGACPQLP